MASMMQPTGPIRTVVPPVVPATQRPPTSSEQSENEGGGAWAVAALFAFALVVGAYFTFRFGGRWTEWDTASQADSIRAMARDMVLLSPSGVYYANGYAFSAISTFILAATGLDPATLTQSLYPLISATLVVVAWPLYREFTGSGRGATLATLILFLQPEFLFVILRGSHERVLRVLLLTSLFLLVRSFKFSKQPRSYAAYVVLFYVATYGMIATNSLFGSSYVWALGLALLGSWLAGGFGPGLQEVSSYTRQRLVYVPILCILLVFIFNSYIYPPAGSSLLQIPDILDRLSRLFLTTSPDAAKVAAYDPYASVLEQWIDWRLYFVLSIGTFVLIFASGASWAWTGLRWLAGTGEPPTLGQWLLWLLYTAFVVQGAISIVADRAGALGGNLQHRSFPSFIMLAAPMIATVLVQWKPGARGRSLVAGGLGVLALLAIAKATNEPSISNKWTFYLPSEIGAVRFANNYFKDAALWTDYDERLRALLLMHEANRADNYIGPFVPVLRGFIISDVIRLRSARLKRPLPPIGGELRVYDNGSSQIYRLRSRTPYQD